jgi:DNA repair exonuclease SbcCD ATPase subunit
VDFDEVADELYEVPPEDFVAVRKERQDQAKAEGDPALAKAIGGLPKPSSAAWVCNLLVRAQRPEIEGLVELGGMLREAQENLAGAQLKALDAQRRQLVSALTRQARAAAYERGHPVSTSVATQVEETLRAAMADPEAGEALLTGRLTSPMNYSGMGTTVSRPDLRLVRPPEVEKPAPARPSRPARKEQPSVEERRKAREREREAARRAAEQQRRRELADARKAAEEAVAQAEEAQAAADDERQRMQELDQRRSSLEARVAELADQLAHAEGEVAEVSAQLKRAERRRKSAEHEAAEAVVARERALARVEELAADDE